MKTLLLFFLFPIIIFAQGEYTGELRIDLKNYGPAWNVTFTLTSIGARWNENYNLTEDDEIVSDNVNSTYPVETSAFFDHISDPGQNPEFAIGLYKVSAVENGVEKAYFYMDWRTSDWSTSLDVEFNYDYGNKRFRNIENTQTIDLSYQTLWNLTNNLLETTDFGRLLG